MTDLFNWDKDDASCQDRPGQIIHIKKLRPVLFLADERDIGMQMHSSLKIATGKRRVVTKAFGIIAWFNAFHTTVHRVSPGIQNAVDEVTVNLCLIWKNGWDPWMELSGKEQSHNLQSQITSQFVELHQILTEKEQRVLTDIQEEEKKILNTMEKHLQVIQENLNSIENEVKSLQEQLDLKDNVSFLKEEAGRKMRVHDEAKSLSVADGALPMERFNNPFFLNTVFRETTDVIKQVSVTLDVETAAPGLEVSEDRKRVRRTRTRRSLPDTGKRFTVSVCVLGSEGFTSGRHYWEVEVAGSRG
ncbi:zinc-binding protein A33-like [Rhinoraja longicauda]